MPRKPRKAAATGNARKPRRDRELPDVKRLFALAREGLIEMPGALKGATAAGCCCWARHGSYGTACERRLGERAGMGWIGR